jgi:hypothetical protein
VTKYNVEFKILRRSENLLVGNVPQNLCITVPWKTNSSAVSMATTNYDFDKCIGKTSSSLHFSMNLSSKELEVNQIFYKEIPDF